MTDNISKTPEIAPDDIENLIADLTSENPQKKIEDIDGLTKYIVLKCLSGNISNLPDISELISALNDTPAYGYIRKHFNRNRWVSEYKERLLRDLQKKEEEEETQKEKFIELDATKKEERKSNNTPRPEKFLNIAKKNQILILLGEAGSGKTTTLRHYFKECLSNLENDTPRQKTPVFIELTRFKEHRIQPLKETLSNIILTTINDKLRPSLQIAITDIDLSNDFILLFDGLDEITLTRETHVAELKNGNVTNFSLDPKEFGFSLCSAADLKGGEPETNAELIREILEGKSGPRTDIVILNAAAAIYVGGKADSIEKGVSIAVNSVSSGAAAKKLEELCRVSNS